MSRQVSQAKGRAEPAQEKRSSYVKAKQRSSQVDL